MMSERLRWGIGTPKGTAKTHLLAKAESNRSSQDRKQVASGHPEWQSWCDISKISLENLTARLLAGL